MKLFTINEAFEVELDKAWIMMIPEFEALFKRDKGSEGDYRGSKKLRTRRELTYIYFMVDFHSPIRDFLPDKKEEEALRYARLKREDIDALVMKALAYYSYLQNENAPSLRTLDALKTGMQQLDNHLSNVNFDAVDKMGKPKYTVESYQATIIKLPKMRTAIKEFERMVEEELRENTGIRGSAVLGIKEAKNAQSTGPKTVWQEGGPPKGDKDSPERETIEM